ncbi:DUF1570 domain-containing protein [Myxococcus qinghaiensis]|uniref:DUF1570 domain-containing protein n=1 Tax=Myxococcus qinghaiensis TaxID=2906758 RepID=UPI0020A779C4|nr:DUF1570 domain-containing protein [Myxococcus qinghaiensis]MCP3168743.1 DUF1570 domain-containing protein [Myxococcus qinghaiensis]
MRPSVVMAVLLMSLMSGSWGCVVGPRFTRCPGEDGRAWVELDSEHYTLRTDLPPEQAREAMSVLEHTRVALLAGMWPGALRQEMAKVLVYVLADPREFEGLYPRRVRAFFYKSDTEALIVLSGPPAKWSQQYSGLSEDSSSRLNHELAHYLSTYVMQRQPLWLSEGLSEYLETLRLSDGGKRAVLGTPNWSAAYMMRSILKRSVDSVHPAVMMRRVLDWQPGLDAEAQEREIGIMYAGSWLMVHWLRHTRPERFTQYQTLLGQGVDPRVAQRQALPELESDSLDQTLLDYVRDIRAASRHQVAVPTTSTAFIERVLDDAEVHASRAKLAALGAHMAQQESLVRNRRKLSRQELKEALRLDPTGLPALSVKQQESSPEERLALARTAVSAHPDESEAWLLLAAALEPDRDTAEEREAALKKALELAPRSSYAASGLAWLYVTQGRFEEALPLAQWAVALAPWSTPALDTLAMTLAGQGRCAEALQLEQRAMGLTQEQEDSTLKTRLRVRLAGLEDGSLCRTSAPTP